MTTGLTELGPIREKCRTFGSHWTFSAFFQYSWLTVSCYPPVHSQLCLQMLRKRTRSSVSAGELNEGLASRPRNPPRGSGLRNGSKYKSRMLSEGIKKLPITLASPEKGTVTIGEYIGEVKGGMMHGEGTIKFYETHFDGSQFEGKFKRGKLVGQGILKYKDGVVYAGEQFSFLLSSNKVVKVALHCQDDDDAVGFSGECTGHFVDGVIHGTARIRYGN